MNGLKLIYNPLASTAYELEHIKKYRRLDGDNALAVDIIINNMLLVQKREQSKSKIRLINNQGECL